MAADAVDIGDDARVGGVGVRRGELLLSVRHADVTIPTGGSSSTDVRAVVDVSVDIHRGERVALVGESGAGKSMLARSIIKLLPSKAVQSQRSTYHFDGVDLSQLAQSEIIAYRGRRISMIFQDPLTYLNPTRTVGSQIAETFRPKLPRAERRARVADALLDVGLSQANMERRYPHELSGGMRQRVLIAMALASGADLLIADEPTTALDVTVQHQILHLVHRAVLDHNMALLLITHDLGVVAGVCDWVYVMYQGPVVESADIDTIFSAPAHPYTQTLLASSRRDVAAVAPTEEREPIGDDACPYAGRCQYVHEACLTRPPMRSDEFGRGASCWLFEPDGQSNELERITRR